MALIPAGVLHSLEASVGEELEFVIFVRERQGFTVIAGSRPRIDSGNRAPPPLPDQGARCYELDRQGWWRTSRGCRDFPLNSPRIGSFSDAFRIRYGNSGATVVIRLPATGSKRTIMDLAQCFSRRWGGMLPAASKVLVFVL